MSEHKDQVAQRLRTIEGHVRGIAKMVDQDSYCIDILKQIDAVQKALDQVGKLVLDDYSNALFSTDASDFNFLKNKTEEGIGLDEAVEQLVSFKRKR